MLCNFHKPRKQCYGGFIAGFTVYELHSSKKKHIWNKWDWLELLFTKIENIPDYWNSYSNMSILWLYVGWKFIRKQLLSGNYFDQYKNKSAIVNRNENLPYSDREQLFRTRGRKSMKWIKCITLRLTNAELFLKDSAWKFVICYWVLVKVVARK